MRDLIDRQDTIDICDVAIDLWNGQFGCGALVAIKDKILELPPAQTEPCEDMISREYLKEHIEACWINGRPRHAPELNELLSWIDDVPSAQTEPIRININEPIKVKLTDWGKEIYYHQYDWINQTAGKEICKPSFPKEDENGYTEFQLWYFIELYGQYMGMTLHNVIEPLEIVYER